MGVIRLALDAMGGDYAPAEMVAGAVAGAREHDVSVLLVGDPTAIERELSQHNCSGLDLEIYPADDVIRMDENPSQAVRSRPQASINRACQAVLEGLADGVVTMGHTGAGMVAALLRFGRLPGVERPAILLPFLGVRENLYLMDAGANTEVRPQHLVQFAQMGSMYLSGAEHIPNPKVGLLSNGGEANKGNQICKQAYPLLMAEDGLNFVGNVEGHDLFEGDVNLLVCDGFLGNVVFKTAEGLIASILKQAGEVIAHIPLEAAAVVRAHLDLLQARNNYARFGAAVLLGVKHPMLIGHGRSKAEAVRNGFGVAKRLVAGGVAATLREKFS